MEDLIYDETIWYKKIVSKSCIKYFSDNQKKIYFFHKLLKNSFKEHGQINYNFFRYASNFILVCSSVRLLSFIKKKTYEFLHQRGLKIYFKKSKTILFGVNESFDFLGYTFIYFVYTKFIKKKLWYKNKLEYRLSGKIKLFLYPSRSVIKSLKICFKTFFKKSWNISVYKLIVILNLKIKKWINYYFFNAYEFLRLLLKWIYKKVILWIKQKHRKNFRILLKKHYFLIVNLFKKYCIKNNFKIVNFKKQTNISFTKRVKQNFYKIVQNNFKKYSSNNGSKINVMFWPIFLKNVKVISTFVLNENFLTFSYYLNQSTWLKKCEKLKSSYINKKKNLCFFLWQRDKGLCFNCEISFPEKLIFFENKIEIYNIVPVIEGGLNKKCNLVLVHWNCR